MGAGSMSMSTTLGCPRRKLSERERRRCTRGSMSRARLAQPPLRRALRGHPPLAEAAQAARKHVRFVLGLRRAQLERG
eukprot:8856841-Alexandrium_andersonii.AAC.1